MQRAYSMALATLVLVASALLGPAADAAPGGAGKMRYYFEFKAVTAKPSVKPNVAKAVLPRVEAEVKKVFGQHPEVVATLDGAPDPGSSSEAFRNFLAKNHIAGAYRVTVEITEATETLTPVAGKPNEQVLAVHLALRMLGERIPDSTIGFNGHGSTTIKQEVGAKPTDADRESTWKDADEIVVADAMKTALAELAASAKAKAK
jgi:hypothetical protein